jgi:hypothetical protein
MQSITSITFVNNCIPSEKWGMVYVQKYKCNSLLKGNLVKISEANPERRINWTTSLTSSNPRTIPVVRIV